MSEGSSATGIPAACKASILPAAVPAPPGDNRAGVPHPLLRRRRPPGDEADDRLADVLPRVLRRLLLLVAADLADEYDLLGRRVGLEERQHVYEGATDNRIAADTDAGALAQAGIREMLDDLIGQRAGA